MAPEFLNPASGAGIFYANLAYRHFNPWGKFMMENTAPKYRCPECGCDEFVTELNSYDTYLAIGGELCYQRSNLINELPKFFCRDCSRKIDDS